MDVIENHIISDKPSETLSILARYYKQKENKSNKDIYNLLNDFMYKYYPNYNPVKWSITLENQVKKSKKYPLLEIDYIPITYNELLVISSLENIRLERLAFTLLCCCKFANMRNESNNNWVNREIKEIFRLARVTVISRKQCEMLHELKCLGLIGTSKKVDNVNINVKFVDCDSDEVIKINDFRELGYEYMSYKKGGYIRCSECGILLKPKNNNQKYCSKCSGYKPIGTKTIVCIDCGKEVVVDALSRSIRCDECWMLERRRIEREKKRKQRMSH